MKIIYSKFFIISLCLLVLFSLNSSAQEQDTPGVWVSRNGEYRLSAADITSSTPNEWTLYIRTSERAPVTDATIEVHGYNPATQKFLPRMPIISPHLGRGQYDVYNLYFDEPGEWDINVIISSGSTVDAILLPVFIP